MTTFLQNAQGDIDITNGRTKLVTGQVEKAQKIDNRLGLFKGEWFIDQRVGTLWWERILGIKNVDLRVVKRVIRQGILSVPGIVRIEQEQYAFTDREFTYSYVAIDDEGQEVTGGRGVPYIQPQD